MIVQELFAKLGLEIDGSSWSKGEGLLNAVKGGFVGLLAALGLNSIGNMIESVVELGGHLNDTAQKTGVAVEALQFYGYVAKLNSSSAEGITHGMTKLNRALGELATKGTGPAGAALNKLGINFSSAEFKSKTLDDKMQMIATSLAKLPDGPEKVALAMDLFGRSGAELIPTLNDLGKNGDELRASFEEMGGAISGDQASALDDFGDNVDKAKYSLTALKNQIVVGMLPTLKELLDGFMTWIKTHREIIGSGIKLAVEVLVGAFRLLGNAISAVVQVYDFLKEHQELARALLIGIAAAIATYVVPALAAMALGWIEALAPIIAVIAVAGGLYLVIKDVWESITTGKGVAATVWNYIVDKFTHASDRLKNVAAKVRDGFVHAWEGIKSAASAAFEWIANLPVIKQLIEVYKWFQNRGKQQATIAANIDKFQYDPTKGGNLQQQYLANAFRGTDVGDNAGIPPGASLTVTQQITVNPSTGMNETDIAKKVAEYGRNQWRDAYDRVSGGRR